MKLRHELPAAEAAAIASSQLYLVARSSDRSAVPVFLNPENVMTTATKKPVKMSPTTRLRRIKQANEHLKECLHELSVAESELKEKKENVNGLRARRNELTREVTLEIDGGRPLLAAMEGDRSVESPVVGGNGQQPPASDPHGQLPLKPAQEPFWQSVPLAGLTGIPDGIVKKLADHRDKRFPNGITTLGDLTEYKSDGSWLTNIKGVGKGAADKIDDATTAYFEKNPVKANEEAKPAAAAKPEPAGVAT